MNVLVKVTDAMRKYRKPLTIVISCALTLGFVGSVVGAIFSGSEFSQIEEVEPIKGIFRLTESCYSDSYIAGDHFNFDKEKSKILLVAKDPAIERVVKIDDLPSSEYGFMINGQGEYYQDASSIIMDKYINTISVVSRVYRELKYDISVKVYTGFNNELLKTSLLLEAENADLYDDQGKLLSQQEKEELPTKEKPYISNKGTDIKGTECSGGAALRNISKGMKVDFRFVSSKDVTTNINLKICQRKTASNFDDGYKMTINGNLFLTNAIVPQGDGYFTPYTVELKDISLKKGVNCISFSYNKANPHNLDALEILACGENNTFGLMDAIIE